MGASLVCDHVIPVLVYVRSSSWLAPMIGGKRRTVYRILSYRNRIPLSYIQCIISLHTHISIIYVSNTIFFLIF